MAFLDFDASAYKPMEEKDFSALPAGKYNAIILQSEMKMTRDQSQVYLETVVTILSGPFKNRKLFDKFYFNHPDPQEQGKARSKLSTLCNALGLPSIKESSELHNIPHNIKVGVGKATPEYPNPSNFVNYYYPYSDLEEGGQGFTGETGAAGAYPAQNPQHQYAAPAGAGGFDAAPPWAQ